MQHPRGLALLRREVCIKRAHSEAIGFAHDRADHDLDWKIQVLHHAANDGGLSRIFLAEESDVWFDGVKELGNNSGHAAKVAGTRPPAQFVAKAFDGHIV